MFLTQGKIMDNLLEIKNLSVFFKSENKPDFAAVKDVSLTVKQGEVLGIVGESGSGKSVTALSVLGLLPYPKAYHGETSSIKFSDKELIGLNNKDFQKIRGNDISIIFQEPMSSLNPLHKVGKQIAESLLLHQNINAGDAESKTLELLKAVKIPQPEEKINAYPFELSGGQRQRVMIAMAIANNPKLLIADEPTTALDVTVQEQIIDLLLELRQKLNMAIIFISHNLRLVHKISDSIAVMYKGELVEHGTADRVFNSPQAAYTKKLISSDCELNSLENISAEEIFKADNITVSFPRKKNIFGKIIADFKAVNQVSLSLNQGETLGIVGESGSGKTTLALSLVNLAKHSGRIYLKKDDDFQEVTGFSRDVQIVFQDPYNSLNPRMTVRQIVGEGLSVHFRELSKQEKESKIIEILKEVDLDDSALNKYPHEFSGGQRQRIALARALIIKPRIVILDEPTSALDVTIQQQIIRLLKNLQQIYGLSYIFISHDMNAVRALAHKIAVMKDGSIIERNTADNIFKYPSHAYTKQLIRASLI